jgi:hypothetical protein
MAKTSTPRSTPAQARLILEARPFGQIITGNGRTLDSMLAKGLIWENREWAHPRYFLTVAGRTERARLIEKLAKAAAKVAAANGSEAVSNVALHREHVEQLTKGVTLVVERAIKSASQNADDTARERGFALFSAPWFEMYALTFESMITTHAEWLAVEIEKAEEDAYADAETVSLIELAVDSGAAEEILTAAPAVVHEGDWTFLGTWALNKFAFLAEPVDGWLYFDRYDEGGRIFASYRVKVKSA